MSFGDDLSLSTTTATLFDRRLCIVVTGHSKSQSKLKTVCPHKMAFLARFKDVITSFGEDLFQAGETKGGRGL
jgi:hypothetical protein